MIALLMPLMLAATSAEMPTYPDLPPDLAAAAMAFDKAQVDGDGAALDRLLADDYLLINSQGQSESKADFIRDYTAKGFSFAPFTIQKPVEKIWATGAVLGGVVDAHGTSDGKAYAIRMRFADIWAKRDGKWRVIYTQARRALPGAAGRAQRDPDVRLHQRRIVARGDGVGAQPLLRVLAAGISGKRVDPCLDGAVDTAEHTGVEFSERDARTRALRPHEEVTG